MSIVANLIWENNSDTPLNAYNLSKTIDVQSESKFLHFTNEQSDYETWADLVIFSPAEFTDFENANYLGQVIYNYDTHECRIIVKNPDNSYSSVEYKNPYLRLLKLKSKTKVTMSFLKNGDYYYNSFDFGSEDKIFSAENLMTPLPDPGNFKEDTIYHVYLYYHVSYGDYAQIKIMESTETAWLTTPADPASPSGYKLISYRKLGGFKTDSDGFIIENSVWDIYIFQNEIVVETLKKSDNDEIRLFDATDLPIRDISENLQSDNVEDALEEIKIKVDQLENDLYTNNRFGFSLKFSPLKKSGSNLISCVTNDLTLKITAGYIDVYGYRVKLEEDIYLASTIGLLVNNLPARIPAALTYLGPEANNVIYDNSTGGEGTIWRIYVDIIGNLYIKEHAISKPKYYNEGKLKGWYDVSTGAGMRCIGKFKVRRGAVTYIEKMSVIDTFELEAVTNSIWAFHSNIAPDGLVACDGLWHDINGYDQNTYNAMPELSQWQAGSWYEETPNLWERMLKMPAQNEFFGNPFTLDSGRHVIAGGSAEAGEIGGSSTHTHIIDHDHNVGNLHISASGEHTHTVQFPGTVSEVLWVTPNQAGIGSQVTTETHDHTMVIIGGEHVHAADDFVGNVEQLSAYPSGATNSWPAYKEILYCIKK